MSHCGLNGLLSDKPAFVRARCRSINGNLVRWNRNCLSWQEIVVAFPGSLSASLVILSAHRIDYALRDVLQY